MLEPNFTQEQINLLNTPPKPDEIEKKQGLSYLKGQAAIVKANRIFGIGNWSYKQVGPIEVTDTGINNSKTNRIYLVSATVELTVRGCETFVEQGDCEAQGMGAPSISMARKGAVTDGVKRCLKNFGPAFGLNLYFDNPEQASSEPAAQPQPQPYRQQPPSPATRPVQTPYQAAAPSRPAPAPAIPTAPRPAPVTAASPILPQTQSKPLFPVEDDDNFKFYASRIHSAKSLKELSDLGPTIKKQVVEAHILEALRLEHKKAEAALTEKANARIEAFVGAVK